RTADGERLRHAVVNEAAVGKGDARDRGRGDGQRGRQHQVVVVHTAVDGGRSCLAARIRTVVIRVTYRRAGRQCTGNGERLRRAVVNEAAVGKGDGRDR